MLMSWAFLNIFVKPLWLMGLLRHSEWKSGKFSGQAGKWGKTTFAYFAIVLLHVSDICGMNHIANFLSNFCGIHFVFACLRSIISSVSAFFACSCIFPKRTFCYLRFTDFLYARDMWGMSPTLQIFCFADIIRCGCVSLGCRHSVEPL